MKINSTNKNIGIGVIPIKFSWETPIEQEMLEWLSFMANTMEVIAEAKKETGWFADNRLSKEASNAALAYRFAEKHLKRQIKIRKRRI